jgi:transcriptional regulator with XRE-family HTH domain
MGTACTGGRDHVAGDNMLGMVTEVDLIVGERIRIRREELGMSERQLASILSVTPDEITAFEGGAERVGAVRLAQTAKALDAPIAYFFMGASATDLPSPHVYLAPSPRWAHGASELVSAYSRLESSQLRDAVLKLVANLARESQAAAPQKLAKAVARVRRSRSQAH